MNHDITLPDRGRAAIYLALDRNIPAQKSLLPAFEADAPRTIVLTADELRVVDDALRAIIADGAGTSSLLVHHCRELHAILAPFLEGRPL